jgi:hypothetical protein
MNGRKSLRVRGLKRLTEDFSQRFADFYGFCGLESVRFTNLSGEDGLDIV